MQVAGFGALALSFPREVGRKMGSACGCENVPLAVYFRVLYGTLQRLCADTIRQDRHATRRGRWYGVDAARGCRWTDAHVWSYDGDGDHEAEMATFPTRTLVENSTFSCASTRAGSRCRSEIFGVEPFHSCSLLKRRVT